MKPIQIKISEKKYLTIKWDDGTINKLTLQHLRDECPCASCKGETILLKTYRPPKPSKITPEMYQIRDIKPVGDYAIQITWKDGHDTGIYTWEYLDKLVHSQDNDGKQNYDRLI